MKTQHQMYYEASTKAAAMDRAVMDMIHCKENPMTREDLEALIRRHPDRYGKYAGIAARMPATKG